MKYVLNENGNIKVGSNGQPLVTGDDGKEFEIDAIGAQDKINTITTESNDRRKKIGTLTEELTEASGNVTTLQTQVDAIDDKNKVKMEEYKDEINKAWEAKEETWKTEKAGLTTQLFEATTGSQFATSKVVGKTVLSPTIAQATFGKNFNADGTAKFDNGNPIYSRSKPGDYAGFDSAITQLIDAHADKDSIWKATDANGSGGHTTKDGNGGTVQKTSGEKIAAGLKAL